MYAVYFESPYEFLATVETELGAKVLGRTASNHTPRTVVVAANGKDGNTRIIARYHSGTSLMAEVPSPPPDAATVPARIIPVLRPAPP